MSSANYYNHTPGWAIIQRSGLENKPLDPLLLNKSKINNAFRKQDRIKELQKY